jgi:hypothetical protein
MASKSLPDTYRTHAIAFDRDSAAKDPDITAKS